MKTTLFALVGVLVLAGCGAETVTVTDTAKTMVDKADTAATAVMDEGENIMEGEEEMMEDAAHEAGEAMEEGKNMAEEAVMMDKTYTLADIAVHNTPADCWTVIDGQVADVTSFFGVHPGGDDNLAKACGIDATTIFEAQKKHDPNGYAKLKELTIGTFVQE